MGARLTLLSRRLHGLFYIERPLLANLSWSVLVIYELRQGRDSPALVVVFPIWKQHCVGDHCQVGAYFKNVQHSNAWGSHSIHTPAPLCTPPHQHLITLSFLLFRFFSNKKEISDDEAAQASGGVDQAATPLPDTANAVVHEFGTWSDGQQLQLVKKLMFKLKHKVRVRPPCLFHFLIKK